MQSKVPVVIVGGGPVGLSMGILLQRFGIDFVLLERSPTTTTHPKARGTYTRTMEIFRQWNIEERVTMAGLPREESLFMSSRSSRSGFTPCERTAGMSSRHYSIGIWPIRAFDTSTTRRGRHSSTGRSNARTERISKNSTSS